MDFTISPRIEDFRTRVAGFVEREVLPLEGDSASYDAHENIRLDLLDELRAKAKAEGLWCLQLKPENGGAGLGKIGMAVCYDVRFPELFRVLQQQGAEILSVPSAFTAPTGKAHWELLMRARAVENLCYVLAPAQSGIHPNERETWGDSLIVDPWGQVLSRVTDAGPGLAVAEIDRTVQQELRDRFPVLSHRRLTISPTL